MMSLETQVTLTLLCTALTCAHVLRNITCQQRESCDSNIGQSSLAMNCGCDKSCETIADCCYDYHYGNMVDNMVARPVCLNMPLVVGTFGIHIAIVTSCPAPWSDPFIRTRCESVQNNLPFTPGKMAADILFYVPVLGKTSRILFMNIYCAICNGEKTSTFLNVDIRNRRPMSIAQLMAMKDPSKFDRVFPRSQVELSHHSYVPRPCRTAVETCDTTFLDVTRSLQCRIEATSYVYDKTGNVYRNRHCAFCNGLQEDQFSCDDPRQYLNQGAAIILYPYSLLFDLNTGIVLSREVKASTLNVTGIFVSNITCQENQVYDPFHRKCIDIYCDNGYHITDGNCERTESEVIKTNEESTENATFCSMLYLYTMGKLNASVSSKFAHMDRYQLNSMCLMQNLSFNMSVQTDVHKDSTLDSSASYLTVVLNTFSVVGLICHLVVYGVFPSLRNTPGKCLMCLSAMLMTSQLIFTLGLGMTYVQPLCYVIAVMLHFTSLAYFCWMSVLAFDIWNTFHTNATGVTVTNNDSSRTFLYYLLFAFGYPAVVVGVSVVFDLMDLDIRPHYAEHVCYFGDQLGLIFFFDVPVAVTIASNTVFLVLTIRNLMVASRSTETVRAHRARQEQHRFLLYTKLAFIMGVTWVVAFIAMATGSKEVWYIYIVLNCLQGVWIFVAFVCTRKVFQLVSERCGDKGELKQMSSHFSSRSKTSTTTKQTTLLDNAALETDNETDPLSNKTAR